MPGRSIKFYDMRNIIKNWIKQYKEIATIKKSPHLISLYTNPAEELQLAAINKHTRNIKYISNPSEMVQMVAVKRNPESIIWIKKPSEKAQLECIGQNPYLINHIQEPTDTVQMAALKQVPTLLKNIRKPTLESILYVAKVSPASLSGRVYDSVTRKAILHENPHCEAFLNIATTKSYLNTIENNPDMFKRVELTSDLLKEIYITELSSWCKEQLLSAKSNSDKIKVFLDGRKINEELQELIVKDNYYNYPYITNPSQQVTLFVLKAVTGNTITENKIHFVENPLKKLILSLYESYQTSKMPLSYMKREHLNNMNINLDDYEIRQNEYMKQLYEQYKEFRQSTCIGFNTTAYIQTTKTFLLENYAKDINGELDSLNIPQGMELYNDCLQRSKVMNGIESAFAVDMKEQILDALKQAKLPQRSFSDYEIQQISNGKPIQVSEGHFLMRVKTPKGIAIKVCHEKKLKNIIVTEL